MGIGITTVRRVAVTAVLAVLGLLAPVAMVGGASAAAVDPIVNVAPPVVTGTAQVGERLRTTTGDWTPAGLTFTYQWLRDGSPIADAVMHMARALGLTTCAEGVENHHQLVGLRRLGCEWGQGFHFAEPLPSEEFASLLRTGRTF